MMATELVSLWPWALAGGTLGVLLERMVLGFPRFVLAPYGDQVRPEDWHGPGGGLSLAPARSRQIVLALLNGLLWLGCTHWSQVQMHHPLHVTFAWLLFASTLLVLAVIDWNTTLLPDLLVLSLLWAGLLASDLGWTRVPLDHSLWSAALWYLTPSTLAWLYARLRRREGMGAGDAKLLAALAAWLGWQPVLWTVLNGSLLLLLASLLCAVQGTRRPEWPFGPFLLLGLLVWTLV